MVAAVVIVVEEVVVVVVVVEHPTHEKCVMAGRWSTDRTWCGSNASNFMKSETRMTYLGRSVESENEFLRAGAVRWVLVLVCWCC